ncbi:MAG TPA: hypothetical protein VFA09_10390 [Ktedonobacteraceae bacterium]|nr:hypothetical protein [Ktedonobacteraceae bacterium]
MLSKEVPHQTIFYGGKLALSISSRQAFEPAQYLGMDVMNGDIRAIRKSFIMCPL